MTEDHVDRMLSAWARSAPDLDVAVLGVAGRILRAATLLERELQTALREHDLTFADFDVLNTLRRESAEGWLNPREIGSAALITSGAVTARLDRIERAGLIAREPDPDDRRGVRVRLTAKGRRTAEQALDAVLAADRAFLAPLGAGDSKAVAAALKRLLVAHEPV